MKQAIGIDWLEKKKRKEKRSDSIGQLMALPYLRRKKRNIKNICSRDPQYPFFFYIVFFPFLNITIARKKKPAVPFFFFCLLFLFTFLFVYLMKFDVMWKKPLVMGTD